MHKTWRFWGCLRNDRFLDTKSGRFSDSFLRGGLRSVHETWRFSRKCSKKGCPKVTKKWSKSRHFWSVKKPVFRVKPAISDVKAGPEMGQKMVKIDPFRYKQFFPIFWTILHTSNPRLTLRVSLDGFLRNPIQARLNLPDLKSVILTGNHSFCRKNRENRDLQPVDWQ